MQHNKSNLEIIQFLIEDCAVHYSQYTLICFALNAVTDNKVVNKSTDPACIFMKW